jgi:membrane-bound lytic murein transglycosylase B
MRWIRQAGDSYGLDSSVLAGVYSIETDFGRLDAPGVRSGENFAGAGGPGQFLEPSWRAYGVDGDGDGVKDRYNPADAISGTANLLRRSGAPADYRRAVFAYKHAAGTSTTSCRARLVTAAPRRPTRRRRSRCL